MNEVRSFMNYNAGSNYALRNASLCERLLALCLPKSGLEKLPLSAAPIY